MRTGPSTTATAPSNQLYWMIGPASENYPLTPTYNAMSLLFHTTVPGWQIIQVEPWQDDDWKLPDAEIPSARVIRRTTSPSRSSRRTPARPASSRSSGSTRTARA